MATNVESALSKTEREHELQVKNDGLEEVLAIVSHDLRNPLTVAEGHLELARENYDDEHLRKVSESVARLSTLIEDLLTLGEKGYVVDSRTHIDLASIAERAWETVHTPDATLEINGSMDLFGDEERLLQVFENLFRNSVEHADDDVTVWVGPLESIHTTTRVSAEDHDDGFYVEDDGPGIPEADWESVFERGYSTNGTGLGLAIVQRIVAAHGWAISVEQPVGSGARFEVASGTKSVSPFKSF